eukprot:UN09796
MHSQLPTMTSISFVEYFLFPRRDSKFRLETEKIF